jgi:hypothetical protein
MKLIINSLLILTLLSCNSKENEKKKNKEQPIVTKDLSSNDSIISIQNDSVPLISGSCKNGREIGNKSQYQFKMTVGSSETDSISVRSDAACFEIAHCDHNILGKIKSGTIVYTTSSLKNRGGSAGIAYAFLVRDQNGDTCRAYMSYMNFEEGLDFLKNYRPPNKKDSTNEN